MERNESLELDEQIESPLFWLHHVLTKAIKAKELEKLARNAYRGVEPTVACRAMQAGAFALEREADNHWDRFCREAA